MAVRFYKASFCVEIWRKNDRATNGKVWALVLTSAMSDDRMRAVKGVWSLMRRTWEVRNLLC